jgi:hypothetical protein
LRSSLTFLQGLGGIDIMLLLDYPEAPRMGGSIGMLLCTYGSTFSSLASITIGSKRHGGYIRCNMRR